MKTTLCDVCNNPMYTRKIRGQLFYRVIIPKLYLMEVEERVDIPNRLDLCIRCGNEMFDFIRKRRVNDEL